MTAVATNPWAAWLAENDTRMFQLSRKQGWDAFVNFASRPQFDTLTLTEMAALTDDELEDYNEARAVWHANIPAIKTQQLAACYDVIDEVMASNRRDSDRLRGAVVIDAEPGLGKTTIATRYARDFHRRVYRRHGPKTPEGHQRLPVAFIPLTAGVTLKGLNQKLLAFYGHPAATRTSRSELTSLTVDCVTSCQTQLIVIDDLHFIDFQHRNGVEVSNHLKGLANELPVTFIYIGVQLQSRRFFDEGMVGEQAAYAQTARRATRCPVQPFTVGTDTGMRAWLNLLGTFEQHLKLARFEPGMLTAHAKLIHRRTQGRIASVTNLLDRAAQRAIRTGTELIDNDILTSVTVDNAAQRLSHTA